MKLNIKQFIKGGILGLSILSVFGFNMLKPNLAFAWHGQLQTFATCEFAKAGLIPNPNTQVVTATINGQETRLLVVPWNANTQVTFNGFIRWETQETWSQTVTVTKPEDCGEPSVTPTESPIPTESPVPTESPIPTESPTQTPVPTQTPNPTNEPGRGGPVGAPICTDTTPPTLKIVSVVSAGSNSVKVTWQKVTPANNYSILYGAKKGDYPYSVFATGDTTNFTINGIKSGCFKVKAVNGCMPGPESPEFCTGGNVLGISTLPNTGASELFALTLFALGLSGTFVYKRFKLV